jgi:hypothetical protein
VTTSALLQRRRRKAARRARRSGLIERLDARRTVFVPELQGRRSTLTVGLMLSTAGELTAVAQWRCAESAGACSHYAIGTTPFGIARVLTLAHCLASKGLA